MCGIIGAVAERDVVPILLEGLKRLEYRGYDSAGVAIIDYQTQGLARQRVVGKVDILESALQQKSLYSPTGIAHTRWATHGKPTEQNAHPHISKDMIAVVHNGIIENHQILRAFLQEKGYIFTSETDTEVVAHLIHYYTEQGKDVLNAFRATLKRLEGSYALAVISPLASGHVFASRQGCPLVVGVGIGEYFVASDVAALIPVTQRIIYLEDGDIVDLQRDQLSITTITGKSCERPIHISQLQADAVERGEFRHYMLKEIFEQPRALAETLEGRIHNDQVLEAAFGANAHQLLDEIYAVQIIACGTSYHAGLVARYWIESLAKLPCSVEIASEFRYRQPLPNPNALVVCISQSGETADTLAALHEAKRLGFGPSLAICNVPESALARAADMVLMTRAGPEIGVASTKAFTTQLLCLLMLTVVLGRRNGTISELEKVIVRSMRTLPEQLNKLLLLNDTIKRLAEKFADKHHTLFLGRGVHYPIAMEGALKLKEISYIHAEAYPAGELKHGPLALVDADMPVVAVAPNDSLQEKLKSNLEEVHARGGQLFIFANHRAIMQASSFVNVIELGEINEYISPIAYTIPLQLLAYHVALIRGTDVDKPRNLAKSVTVE
ncbi:glutamine--fructose-6-phosphate transaminase (isomerizing) [Beggiatoa leptomitoformis]|uniref:Glutamine--fructose-6-phosphate aminotransferase [isomerizing] n=1 Tax=Beggiatoa leptomitoformis TaxID=288004 RepID=A0A2N9YH95_9GAMM|nr:glutamine--fructose-6-phosphate transaminase (isomerizing) [Beggiatoa leptomitoformis]ALG67844.1 glutamine--fructose-6-phosphate transaminase (isomerizing) [Beggiatoa leptomitoformis]AUI69898.1 glutamine--fructose-6-phosphate transaminase (isomerizing) [Beggiatoa leptomitoformis]